MFAIQALGDMKGYAAPAVSALVELLETDPDTRTSNAQTLGKLGMYARKAIPSLQALVNDPDPKVGQFAQQAIREIGAAINWTLTRPLPVTPPAVDRRRPGAGAICMRGVVVVATDKLEKPSVAHCIFLDQAPPP